MRGLLIALCLLPAIALGEIPLSNLSLYSPLTRPDGQPFGRIGKVAVGQNEQIAVLDAGTDTIHIFHPEWKGFTSWTHVAELRLPGADAGPILDYDFDGTTLVYMRRDRLAPDALYRLLVAEATSATWQTYATHDLRFSNGPVAVRGGRIAVSRVDGVQIFERGASGWNAQALLPRVGLTRTGSAVGPLFAMDGNRVLLGTNILVLPTHGNIEYTIAAGILYERTSAGTWRESARFETDRVLSNASRAGPIHVSLKGNQASVAGRVFRFRNWGWEQSDDFSPPTAAPESSTSFDILTQGLAVMPALIPDDQDVYRLSADNHWRPYFRLPTEEETGIRILTINGNVGVAFLKNTGSGLLFNFLVSEIGTNLNPVPRSASIINTELRQPAAAPGQQVDFSLSAWVPNGAHITGIYNATGNASVWSAMAPIDGRFDDAFEMVRGSVYVDPSTLSGQSRVNVRVFDSLGRVTELLGTIAEPGPIIEVLDPAQAGQEKTPPRVSEVMMVSPRIAYGGSNLVYAFADDSPSGTVKALQFRIDDGVWRSMEPFPDFDGPFVFNRAWKSGKGILPPAVIPGQHTVRVRAIDAAGNVSAIRTVQFEVLAP